MDDSLLFDVRTKNLEFVQMLTRYPPLNRKILIVAEHASAIFGGEALIPYQYFKQLRKMGVDVHLLVHQRTRQELQTAFGADTARLHFVADSAVNVWCYKIGQLLPDRIASFTFGAVSHLDTQIRQLFKMRSLHRIYGYDVVHEPIPVSPKLPSMLFGISAPVVIGPMNGGMDYPPHYRKDSSLERLTVSFLRATAVFWNVLLPGKRRAALLLVANQRTRKALPRNLKSLPILELIENGVDTELFRPRSEGPVDRKVLRIIHIGRLVDVKRIDLLIEACSKLVGQINFRLDLVGDGPLRGELERQVEQLSLTPHVKFLGRVAQARAAELLGMADVMVFPSMRECGGAVVLEAMASGVPVIAANWGGPADYITPETGILIPPGRPAQFVDAAAEAMLWMAYNPEARVAMGRAGRKHTEELYDWKRKAALLLQIYSDVITQAKPVCP